MSLGVFTRSQNAELGPRGLRELHGEIWAGEWALWAGLRNEETKEQKSVIRDPRKQCGLLKRMGLGSAQGRELDNGSCFWVSERPKSRSH